MSKLIFISHIHEEAEVAQAIQQAIEEEFSGFVDVFVSSDGKSIPAGANFLKRIEDGLIDCVGAMYLISPISITRNWINFELGAVWVRNSLSVRNSGPEIPAIPICHSGITPGSLPMPLSNLNAISGNSSSQLEFAFKAIQNAVRGRGILKTDFDVLAQKITNFEKYYTLGSSLLKLFLAVGATRHEINQLINQCQNSCEGSKIKIKLGFRDNNLIQILKSFEVKELKGFIDIVTSNPGMQFGTAAAITGAEVEILFDRDAIIESKVFLNDKMK